MGESVYFALVLSLRDDSGPKIVPARNMFKLTSDMKAIPLNPKNKNDFSKSREYGRVVVIDGEQKMVRHVIFALADNHQDLKDLFNTKKKRFVQPKRLSMSLVVEPLNAYTYPDNNKSSKAKTKENKKSSKKSKQLEGERILKKHLKGKGTESDKDSQPSTSEKKLAEAEESSEAKEKVKESRKSEANKGTVVNKKVVVPQGNVGEDVSGKSKNDISQVDAIKIHNIGGSSSIKLDSQSDFEGDYEEKDCGYDNAKNGFSAYSDPLDTLPFGKKVHDQLDGEILTPHTLTIIAESVVAEERKRRLERTCSDVRHHQLQRDLDDALKKYEDSSREIATLKEMQSPPILNEMKQDVTKIKQDITEMKCSLQLIQVQGASAAPNKSEVKQNNPCSLSLLKNLVADEGDDEVVPEGKVKVDEDKFIDLKDIIHIEKKVTYLTTRIEKLCDLFCGGHPQKYSLTGFGAKGAALIKFSDNDIKSMTKILKAMSWNYQVEITEKVVRNRLSRYTSDARSEGSQKPLEKKLKRKTSAQLPTVSKKPKDLSSESSGSSNEEEPSKGDDLNHSYDLN